MRAVTQLRVLCPRCTVGRHSGCLANAYEHFGGGRCDCACTNAAGVVEEWALLESGRRHPEATARDLHTRAVASQSLFMCRPRQNGAG